MGPEQLPALQIGQFKGINYLSGMCQALHKAWIIPSRLLEIIHHSINSLESNKRDGERETDKFNMQLEFRDFVSSRPCSRCARDIKQSGEDSAIIDVEHRKYDFRFPITQFEAFKEPNKPQNH